MENASCVIANKEWLFLFLGFVGTFIWLVIIYQIKPKLTVTEADFTSKLRIKVQNKGCFDAVNINIEACAVMSNDTYHFEIDRANFIAIPHKKRCHENGLSYERVFKSNRLAESASIYQEDIDSIRGKLHTGESILRVRIHACHAFTGFGRLHEYKFRYDTAKGLFVKA